MKQSVKTIVDSIEKEIDRIIDNAEHSATNEVIEFDFGKFEYNLEFDDSWNKWEEHRNRNLTLYINDVTVTNENSKVLTNLSTEVFNQLEITYTNY